MFENTAALRELPKKEFKLDEGESLRARVKVSKVVVAWESAKGRATKLAEMDGEAGVRELPKKVALPDFFAIGLRSKKSMGS